MSAWKHNVKALFLKGLERVGQTASSMASNAHQKLDELNIETRRRELLHEIPVQALELWKNGAALPEQLSALLAELNDLDQQLTVMRAKRFAKLEEESTEEAPAEEVETHEEPPAEEAQPEPAHEEEEPQVHVTEEDETGGNA